MRFFLLCLCVVGLAACGSSRSTGPGVTRGGSGPIERACNASDRRASDPVLCNCVQQTADLTLSGGDQSLAATFFSNPQRAQDIRQSDRASDEAFWTRYKEFANAARTYCGSVA